MENFNRDKKIIDSSGDIDPETGNFIDKNKEENIKHPEKPLPEDSEILDINTELDNHSQPENKGSNSLASRAKKKFKYYLKVATIASASMLPLAGSASAKLNVENNKKIEQTEKKEYTIKQESNLKAMQKISMDQIKELEKEYGDKISKDEINDFKQNARDMAIFYTEKNWTVDDYIEALNGLAKKMFGHLKKEVEHRTGHAQIVINGKEYYGTYVLEDKELIFGVQAPFLGGDLWPVRVNWHWGTQHGSFDLRGKKWPMGQKRYGYGRLIHEGQPFEGKLEVEVYYVRIINRYDHNGKKYDYEESIEKPLAKSSLNILTRGTVGFRR